MANTYTLLETVTVGAAGASSVTFNSIPQTGYTDLKIVMSVRSANASNFDNPRISINGSTSTFTRREIYVESGSFGSESVADRIIGNCPAASVTASTFGSLEFYLPNYTSSNYKSWTCDSVTENNSATNSQWLLAGLWSTVTAVSTIAVSLQTSANFAQYSTFSLYGVSALGTTPTKAPKATGGSIIQTDGTYWYHAFLSSGTFTPATALTCDVLVVAGGGGGGAQIGGGGGAGGVFYATSQLVGTSAQTVTIGAGGTGGVHTASRGANGGNSSFASLTAGVGGGGGGTLNVLLTGANGGSGGGGSSTTLYEAGGSSTQTGTGGTGYGFAGGSGVHPNGGGGGGSGAVGSTAAGNGGTGGAGLNTWSSWLSTTGLGVSGYIAGGGGGASNSAVASAGGSGGGGAGGGSSTIAPVAGTANTGSGGGGSRDLPASGESGGRGGAGLVIIRYLAA